MSFQAVLFYLFGGMALASSVAVVTRKSPVIAALFLAVTLAATAPLILLLYSPFIFVMQILVYAGAVIVLFLFIIMLLNPRPEELGEAGRGLGHKMAVGLMSVAMLVGLMWGLGAWGAADEPMPAPTDPDFGGPEEIGRVLILEWLPAFETAGFLLLVAVIGAMVLARKDTAPGARSDTGEAG